MKLKQRVVLLAILLVIFIFTKVFLIDNSDSSLTNREDQHSFQHMIDKLKIELNPNLERTLQSPWEIAAQWVVPREVYPEETPELGAILHAMATKKIIKADVGYKGTQLKALLVLDGGQKVVFKPKRILGFRRAPVVVGRYVNLNTEIKPVASEQLLSTFLIIGNNSCFYGKCYYCRESEPACADGHVMEGSVTLWLPDIWPLQKHRHPWGRTYREGKLARWEYDESYCDAVKKTPPYDSGPRLLDIIDTAIFDYLIGNADRHHYESFQDDGGASMLILLDNAKSFGTPTLDERSILASVYQCCIIRVSTWNRLNYLKNGVLSTAMRTAMSHDPISPILTDAHLEAMDRRLMSVIATIKQCIEQFGTETVLVEDRMQLSHMK
ncbi:glycosaminoglycan xylosylkinase isoform X2 [Narcine bancroftii]|uniref:glycosaminoglycan xylosylkinase isoform X2 n=1 Tax=Narcine bancroftii TaxID=1343680 RepID=UPI003831DA1B